MSNQHYTDPYLKEQLDLIVKTKTKKVDELNHLISTSSKDLLRVVDSETYNGVSLDRREESPRTNLNII